MTNAGLRSKAYACLHRKSRWELDALRRKCAVAESALSEMQNDILLLDAELARLNQHARAQFGAGSFIDPLAMAMHERYHQSVFTSKQRCEEQLHACERLVEDCRKALVQSHKKEKYLDRRVAELRLADELEVQRKLDNELDDLFLARRR